MPSNVTSDNLAVSFMKIFELNLCQKQFVYLSIEYGEMSNLKVFFIVSVMATCEQELL